MTERRYVRNELSGTVESGPVIQAGAVHGDVVFNPSSTSPDQAAYEAEARARTRARWAAEDAARAYRAAKQEHARRSGRRFRWVCSLVMVVSFVGGVLWSHDEGSFWAAVLPFCLAAGGWCNSHLNSP